MTDKQGFEHQYRHVCLTCRQTGQNCLCPWIESFDPKMKIVILTHPLEFRRRVATGRISHLCLRDSEILVGHDYSSSTRINGLLSDTNYFPVILYPGRDSKNLTTMEQKDRADIFPNHKRPLLFVVDGTWNSAKKMVRLSQNLAHLPQICFTPQRPSTFRVRKQPRPNFYSTVEAIHETLELFGNFQLNREHDILLRVFNKMVERQLQYIKDVKFTRHKKSA